MRSLRAATEDQIRRLDAVTDTGLARLDLEALLDELLNRVRKLLSVDTAAVLLHEEHGNELVATAASGLEEEVRQGVRIPIGKGFAGRIAAERHPVILERVNHTTVRNPLLWEKGIRSLLGVPLLAEGRVVGVLHVGTLTARSFSDDDAHLLQLVGDRIALATQARRSRIQRAAASALQRSLLPGTLPEIPGIEFATRYVPGSGTGVGGDWYDVFALPGERWGIVIGDVAGHGLPAATVMGRLRSVLRAYATDCADPGEVMAKLDEYVRHFEPATMVTVGYAVLEPCSNRLRISTAGHLPPALAVPGDTTALLDLPVDRPIGAGDAAVQRCTSDVELPSGAVLVLYTDGLAERRGVPLDVSLEQLRATVSAGPAESVCARIMSRMIGTNQPEDDIAILVASRNLGGEIGTPTSTPWDE